jgi:hypothetical protein
LARPGGIEPPTFGFEVRGGDGDDLLRSVRE